MKWDKARAELQKNGTPLSAIGYCKIAFDLGQESRPRYDDFMRHLDDLQNKLKLLEAENIRLRKYIQCNGQVEVLTCKQ